MSRRIEKDHLPVSTGTAIELDELACPDVESITRQENGVVNYSVEDTPSWPLCVLLGFQVSSLLVVP